MVGSLGVDAAEEVPTVIVARLDAGLKSSAKRLDVLLGPERPGVAAPGK